MVSFYQGSFNAGETSPLIEGQHNLEKKGSMLAYANNVICLKQGPVTRRGGTKYIGSVKTAANRTQLLKFQFSTGDNYQIEFGDQYFRFYKNRTLILSGGSPYEVVSPYVQANLFDGDGLFRCHVIQSADVLYIFHPLYKPRSLARLSDTNWVLTSMSFVDGPYLDLNSSLTTLTPSATSGFITLTASSINGINWNTGFKSTDVGRLLRFLDSGNKWHSMIITAYTSTTVVSAQILVSPSAGTLASKTGTINWRLSTYSDTTGWPTSACIHQGRVFIGGAAYYPDRVDSTKSGGYSSIEFYMGPSNDSGVVAADNGFTVILASDQVNPLSWLLSDTRGLVAGTTGEEWIIRSSSNDEVLTPSNAKPSPLSRTGSARLQALRADTGSIFLQYYRRRMFDIIYDFEQDTQKPRDITIMADHITADKVIQFGYMQEPFNVIVMLTLTGKLLFMTYYPDQKIFGVTRVTIGGTFGTNAFGKVESFCVTRSPDGSRDELYLTVARTVNGSTVRYIEYMDATYEEGSDKKLAFYVDSGKQYTSHTSTSVTGLSHLEDQTVKVMLDGKSHPDRVVSSGSITLNSVLGTGSTVNVGLSAPWEIETTRPDIPTRSGATSMMENKRVNGFKARFYNSLGLFYGVRAGTLDEYSFHQGASFDEDVDFCTCDTDFLALPDGYNNDGKIYLTHDGVFPMTLIALKMYGDVNER